MAERPTHTDDGECDCFACHIRSINFDPRAMPSRRNTNPPRINRDANAWERGIKRDGRGVPLLKADGSVIGLKEYSEKRHHFEGARRALANA